jgi:hypothetical protein
MREVDCFYGKNKRACIIEGQAGLYVEFFENDILVGMQECLDYSINWAEEVAQEYCNGLISIKPYWEKEFGSGTSNILKSALP